jgi:tetratricopeptide (TPR) repeat protein
MNYKLIDFNTLRKSDDTPDEVLQRAFLGLMQNIEFTEELNLSGCIVVIEANIRALLMKSPRLKKLKLSNYAKLNSDVIEIINNDGKQLEEIYFEGYNQLLELKCKINLPKLTVLSLCNCSNLKRINIEGPFNYNCLKVANINLEEVIINYQSYLIFTAEYWKKQATELSNLKKYKEAHEAIDEVLKLKPKNDEAFNIKGDIFYCEGKYSEAVLQNIKALEINKSHAVYWRNKADALNQLKKYKKAHEAID